MALLRLIVLALANFAVGTAELVIAGVLPLIAADLNVSAEAVGWLVTTYALVFAFGGPLFSGFSRRIDRRKLLLLGLGLFVAGNALAIVTSNYTIILGSRVIAASGSAISSAQALSVGAKLVPSNQRGRALAVVFAGFSAAAVLGVPLGTLIGQNLGWRMTFGLVIGLGLVAAAGVRLLLPPMPPQPTPSLTATETAGGWPSLLRQPAVLAALLVSLLYMTGQYTLYTYLAPFLTQTARLTGNEISLILFIYGFLGTVGSLLGGYLVDRAGVLLTLIICLVLTALSLTGLGFSGPSFMIITGLVAVWGLFAWGFAPIQQYRLLELATPRFGDLVVSLNLSVFNLGIAAGSAIGGVVIGTGNLGSLGLVGGGLLVPAIGLTLTALLHQTNSPRPAIENQK